MSRMLQIEMLPAAHGDAIWIEYGSVERPHRLLIDDGPINAYGAVHRRLHEAANHDKHVDLFVITHIDTDDIDGAVLLCAMIPSISTSVTSGSTPGSRSPRSYPATRMAPSRVSL